MMDPPLVKGFRPYGPGFGHGHGHGHGGGQGRGHDLGEPVFLLFEEYEAIRLCDYEGNNHSEASAIMSVSRPTFTRIYAEARRKMASALVEGRSLVIEGGKVFYDSDWFRCRSCGCYFNNPEKMQEVHNCPLCGSGEVEEASPDDK
jgi:predicted DNA-binding protein (UPF0251 family)